MLCGLDGVGVHKEVPRGALLSPLAHLGHCGSSWSARATLINCGRRQLGRAMRWRLVCPLVTGHPKREQRSSKKCELNSDFRAH